MAPSSDDPGNMSRQDAARQLCKKYTPYLLRLIQRRLHPILKARLDPEDIMQAVWLRFLTKVPSGKGIAPPRHFIAFLSSMVLLCVRAAHRDNLDAQKRSTHLERAGTTGNRVLPVANPQFDPARLAETEDSWKNLLDRIPHSQQEVFLLLRDGCTVKEIAAKLLMDKRAIRRLARTIAQHFGIA